MKHKAACLIVVLIVGCAKPQAAWLRRDIVPLGNAHAHNDYAHGRPLKEAIECGFTSVEADIHLVNGQLLVAHDRKDVTPKRTLEALYLEPLRRRINANDGRVFLGADRFVLMIDIKSDPTPTYAALKKHLRRYVDMLTTYENGRRRAGAIDIVLTGGRPPTTQLAAEETRIVAADGNLSELDQNWPVELVPQFHAAWETQFKWRGDGSIPENERQKLRDLVQTIHAQGKQLRLWAAPDQPRAWNELVDAGVDWINTDDLIGFRDFMRRRRAACTRTAPAGSLPDPGSR